MENSGEQFLHQRDPKLHTTPPIEKTRKRAEARGETTSQRPAEKIGAYLGRLNRILDPQPLQHPDFDRKQRNLEMLKKSLYDDVIIKPENLPQSYFANQTRLAREQGYGDIEISAAMREQAQEVIIADQRSTLDNWIEYFTSPDSNSYPIWAKYWVFTGMLQLSTFDKEKHAFGKRDKNTVAPFPDLNREALSYVIDAIVKKVNKKNIPAQADNPELQTLLQGANFGKLYVWAIEKVTPAQESELTKTDGEWVKYNQGSDHRLLVESLQGHGTGWCTVGEETAKNQLQNGDFYVYYSYDQNGQPTIPRIAIRMQGQSIGEVRGIAAQQNLDPYIVQSDILDKKLKEFGQEGVAYQKKSADMKQLTEIDHKTKRGEDLSIGDLRFLYEFGSKIQGFGYQKDPRINEIIQNRNIKADISRITGFSEDEISLTLNEALKGGIKYHYGDLYLGSLTSAKGLKLPESIGGYLNFYGLTSAKGLELPESIGGYLILGRLTSAEREILRKIYPRLASKII